MTTNTGRGGSGTETVPEADRDEDVDIDDNQSYWQRPEDGLTADEKAGLQRITQHLERYLKHEAIPHVIKQPADSLNGHSMQQLVNSHQIEQLETIVARMFDLYQR